MVRAEKENPESGKKRRTGGWLALAGMVFLLPVLALVIPAAHPIDAQLGSIHLWVGTTFRHSTMTAAQPRQGLAPVTFTTTQVHDLNDRPYQVKGAVRGATFRLADWVYYAIWFQGKPAP